MTARPVASKREKVVRRAPPGCPDHLEAWDRLVAGWATANGCPSMAVRNGQPAIGYDQAIRLLTTVARPLPVSVKL